MDRQVAQEISPRLPWGTGGGKPPGGGLGAILFCGRAGSSSAGCGAAAPRCGACAAPGHGNETGCLASIRTRATGFRGSDLVHDLIPVSLFQKGWDAAIFGAHSCCRLAAGGASGVSRSSQIYEIVSSRAFAFRWGKWLGCVFLRRGITERLIVFAGFPQGQQDDGKFPRGGDDGFLLRRATASRRECEAAAFQIAIRAEVAEDVLGGTD